MSYINQFNNSKGQPIINSFSETITGTVDTQSAAYINLTNQSNNGLVSATNSNGEITFNVSGVYTVNISFVQVSGGDQGNTNVSGLYCYLPYTNPPVDFYLYNVNAGGWSNGNSTNSTFDFYNTGSDTPYIATTFYGKNDNSGTAYNNYFYLTLTFYASQNQYITLANTNTTSISSTLNININLNTQTF